MNSPSSSFLLSSSSSFSPSSPFLSSFAPASSTSPPSSFSSSTSHPTPLLSSPNLPPGDFVVTSQDPGDIQGSYWFELDEEKAEASEMLSLRLENEKLRSRVNAQDAVIENQQAELSLLRARLGSEALMGTNPSPATPRKRRASSVDDTPSKRARTTTTTPTKRKKAAGGLPTPPTLPPPQRTLEELQAARFITLSYEEKVRALLPLLQQDSETS